MLLIVTKSDLKDQKKSYLIHKNDPTSIGGKKIMKQDITIKLNIGRKKKKRERKAEEHDKECHQTSHTPNPNNTPPPKSKTFQ